MRCHATENLVSMTCIQDPHEHEPEGVIKYQLTFHEQALSESLIHHDSSSKTIDSILVELNSSRSLLAEKGLIGQDPCRYGGDGFGNISTRIIETIFLISGSQTGHIDRLRRQDLALVDHFDIRLNQLSAYGLTKPSSESMTHGVCYQSHADITAVIHVHSPDIWQAIDALNIPFTDADIPYGTPQMAYAVAQLLKDQYQVGKPTIFGMKGHQDGIVAVGDSFSACTFSLLECLNQSILMKRYR